MARALTVDPFTKLNDALLNATLAGANYVGIDAADLPSGYSVKIKVKAVNFFNKSSEGTVTIDTSSKALPTVQIVSRPSSLDATKAFSVSARASQSSCGDSSVGLAFNWAIVPNLTLVDQSILQKPTLSIPAKTFDPGTAYTIKVTVYPTNDTSVMAFDSFDVSAKAPEPTFTMATKDFTAGVSADTSVKVYFFDPLNSSNLTWSCQHADNSSCSYASNNFSLADFTDKPKVDIPKDTLLPNLQYMFTAAYTPGYGRSPRFASVTITTQAAMIPVPFVAVQRPAYQARTVLTTDAVGIIGGLVGGTFDARNTVSYTWTSLAGPGLTVIDVSSWAKIAGRLNIPANNLEAGAKYRFQCAATLANTTYTAAVDLSVADKPVVGDIGVSIWGDSSRSVGTAMQDTYDLTADQWTALSDVDLPLTYRFEVFTSTDTSTSPVISIPFQDSGKFLTRLPEGKNDEVTVRVTARTVRGATASKVFPVRVNAFSGNTAALASTYETAKAAALESGDTSALVQLSAAVGKKAVENILALRGLSTSRRLRRDAAADEVLLNTAFEDYTSLVESSAVTSDNVEQELCTTQMFFQAADSLDDAKVDAMFTLVSDRMSQLKDNSDPTYTFPHGAKKCHLDVMSGIARKYKASGGKHLQTAQIVGTTTAMNILSMRSLPCDADPVTYTGNGMNQTVQKTSLPDGVFNDQTKFPENFAAGNCYCIQQTDIDKGLFDDSNNAIGSIIRDISVRDCSTVDDEPRDGDSELSVIDLPQPITLDIPVDSDVDLTGKVVKCAYVDANGAPSTAGVDTSYDTATSTATCSSDHLTSFILLLEDAPSSTTAASTSTATNTPTPTTTETPGAGGLPTGAIAGIAVGAIAVVLGIGGGIFYFMRK